MNKRNLAFAMLALMTLGGCMPGYCDYTPSQTADIINGLATGPAKVADTPTPTPAPTSITGALPGSRKVTDTGQSWEQVKQRETAEGDSVDPTVQPTMQTDPAHDTVQRQPAHPDPAPIRDQ